ncbi:hypothetical protein JQC91_02120 [Jannaschia sp. Os4]|uniref:hypothetical protein n=1 Tax=Jannaschia sp. Os4 TaxID=2807617 RepID=UPI001939725D|nr:hypothetical protein [Jannaschia sp. Os4]MBM2575089.1 hypothetical protein [Jannaschia sp. Os4]
MSRPPRSDDPAHLATGAALLAISALAVPALPGPLVALGLVLATLRLLWLEENVFDALVEAARRRGAPRPHVRATAMRAEAQAWSVALAGTMVALLGLGLGGAAGLLAGGAAFGIGLWRVERLAATLDVLARGEALESAALGRPVAAALSSRPRDRR